MGTAPSNDVMFLALALSPKSSWDGFEKFVDTAEASPVSFVVIPGNKLGPSLGSAPVALGKMSVTVKLTPEAAEQAINDVRDKSGPEYERLSKEHTVKSEFGEYLELSKITPN